MIRPFCDKCGKELESFGAIFFDIPFQVENGMASEKFHFCLECRTEILEFIGKIKQAEREK